MAIIVKIEKISRDKSRVKITLDDGAEFPVNKETLLLARLKEGSEISTESLAALIEESEDKTAFLKGLDLVSRARHTEKMLRQKLSLRGFSEKSVDYALTKLSEYGYIDDEAYARAYAESSGKTSGRLKLAFDLKNKGIDGNVINSLIDKDREEAACKSVAEKFLRTKSGKEDIRGKLYRHLLGRGFDYSLSARVSLEMTKGEGDDPQDT